MSIIIWYNNKYICNILAPLSIGSINVSARVLITVREFVPIIESDRMVDSI